jgi:hypothetical protein
MEIRKEINISKWKKSIVVPVIQITSNLKMLWVEDYHPKVGKENPEIID